MGFPRTKANSKPVPMFNEARTGGLEWENRGTRRVHSPTNALLLI